MKEDFLHYVWQYKLFKIKSLYTTNKEPIEIVKFGIHNSQSGPDFLNAQVRLQEQLWAGNIEIHLKSSDWYAHHHENDANYDAVILHVVWEHDTVVFDKNNQPIPTLILKDRVTQSVVQNYQQLFASERFTSKTPWIPCENQIKSVDDFTLRHWLERLYFERLQDKSEFIYQLLAATNNDFEAVLFQLVAKNFGLNVNGDSFLSLAKSLDFAIVRKERTHLHRLTALLFGQGGFLENDLDIPYYQQLKYEYAYLVKKHQLNHTVQHHFQFFRMRPSNFPTLRIAQLAALFHQQENLFSKIITLNKREDFYDLFAVQVDHFWQTHYTFETPSKKSSKKLTKAFLDLILINTVVPLQFVYQQQQNKWKETALLPLITSMEPEKNAIISKFKALGISANSAFETQSLLQLKKNYCAPKRCLACAIGNKILNKT